MTSSAGEDLGWAVPPYAVSLRHVVPTALASLGLAPGSCGGPEQIPAPLPPARRAVVVLADGLGELQLRRRAGHAPVLRAMEPVVAEARCGFPSTTAVSLASLGTGLLAGEHGLVGWHALVPSADRLVNHLSWEDGPDPQTWQPHPTLFERASAAGVRVTMVGPAKFAGSGLTRAVLRGARAVPALDPEEAVRATAAALQGPGPALVYLYWGDIDRTGHVHGPDGWQWTEQLELLDDTLADLLEAVPTDTLVTVTADHGMVHAPHELRLDLAVQAELARGIRHLGGEPRGPQPHCRPGAVDDVHATWTEVLDGRALVLTRAQAVDAGWFGPVEPQALPRIGDLVVAMRGRHTVLDSRALRPQVLTLVGQHGSLTDEETLVPWRWALT